jgi:hypothetical protein
MKLYILLWFWVCACHGFIGSSGSTSNGNRSSSNNHHPSSCTTGKGYKYFPSQEDPFSDNSNETVQQQEKKKVDRLSDLKLNQALQDRIASLREGIGKRYICRTQKGFLNVHADPADPYETANIVNQLVEGQVVTSTAPSKGPWIRHDAGGWSISIFGGRTWLEPLEEDK